MKLVPDTTMAPPEAAAERSAAEEKPAEVSGPARRRRRWMPWAALVVGFAALAVMTFLAFELGISSLVETRSQAEMLRDLQNDIASGAATVDNYVPPVGRAMALLSIPRIGASWVVVEGTERGLLKLGPGHLRGTPMPGQVGNVVIAGRRSTYGAPFQRLAELQPDDLLTLATGQGVSTYVVVGTELVSEGENDVVGSTRDSRLTLITANPEYQSSERLAVIAALQGTPAPAADRPAVALTESELGLVGQVEGLGPALVWFELLVLTLGVVWYFRRRSFPSRVLYLFAVPVILALIVMCAENLDRAFPGTL